MKKYLFILAAILLSSNYALGQKLTVLKPKKLMVKKAGVKTPTVKKPIDAFPREKFDPTRNAVADLSVAIGIATRNGKRIILDVGGEWCGWCVYMDKFFHQNVALAKLRDDNFIWVKVNMSPENENSAFLSTYPAASGYPHLYVLDETGNLLHSQDTASLEEEKGYNLVKFAVFLETWSPKRK